MTQPTAHDGRGADASCSTPKLAFLASADYNINHPDSLPFEQPWLSQRGDVCSCDTAAPATATVASCAHVLVFPLHPPELIEPRHEMMRAARRGVPLSHTLPHAEPWTRAGRLHTRVLRQQLPVGVWGLSSGLFGAGLCRKQTPGLISELQPFGPEQRLLRSVALTARSPGCAAQGHVRDVGRREGGGRDSC